MTAALVVVLSAWYERVGRDLPWRRTRSPYAIWISEVMLQQTQVATVLPFYARWMARFPDVLTLAQAPIDDVMKQWEGLGYYARCRNLHRAAGVIVAQHDGRFPTEMDAVLALPGIGRSTAGAILTFAHGQRHPLLDGNVRRVLTRLYDVAEDPARAAIQRDLWAHSTALLERAADPWTHNQAIMELGATVCTPRDPACPTCPVAAHCRAREAGTQSERPVTRKRKPLPHKHIGAGVVSRDGRILIQLRPPAGLLGGLWEFPGGKQEPDESIEETVRRELREELGIEVGVGARIATVKHTYSHFRITLHAFACDVRQGEPRPQWAVECRWVLPEELRDYAFPKANRTILDALLRTESSRPRSHRPDAPEPG